jgi:protein-S-isoprenylcysteine O-methyltransferase Ste14
MLLLIMVIGLHPVQAGGTEASDRLWNLVGLLVAAAGESLRVLVIGTRYIRRGGLNKKVYADSLVTEGLFAHCRNPLYVGNLLLYVGLFIIYNNPWAYVIGLALALFAYSAIVAAEEDFLLNRFGQQYQDYCRRVPRWIPRLSGLRATLADGRFDWARVLRKEHTQLLTLGLGCMLVWARETLAYRTVHESAGQLLLLAISGVVLVVIWRGILEMKRTGRLGQDATPEG